jgi:hypothetical protein
MMKFTGHGLNHEPGWIDCVSYSFSNLSGATSASTATTARYFAPHLNIPIRSAHRNVPRSMLRQRNESV